MPCCKISDCAQMSKTIIAVRHFGLGGRESLETAVIMILAGLQCSKRCQFNNCFVFFCHGEQSNSHETFAKAYTVNIMLFQI